MKTLKDLASEIAKREGKKSQARIGDIREILGILSDLIEEWDPSGSTPDPCRLLIANGRRRAKRKNKA